MSHLGKVVRTNMLDILYNLRDPFIVGIFKEFLVEMNNDDGAKKFLVV